MNSYEINFDIRRSVFERAIDPRFFIDDLRELGELEVEVFEEKIPSIDEEVNDSHCFKARVLLKTQKSRTDIEEILEFILNEGVEIRVLSEEKSSENIVETQSEEIPKRLLENYFIESKNVINRLNESLTKITDDRENKELLNSLFRDFHTLKGGTGVLLSYKIEPVTQAIKDIAHLTEGMLVKYRDQGLILDDEDIDLLQNAIDRLDDLITAFEQKEAFNENDVDELLDLLQSKMDKNSSQKKATPKGSLQIEVLRELANQYLPLYKELVKKREIDESETLFLTNSLETLIKIARENGFEDVSSLAFKTLSKINEEDKNQLFDELTQLIALIDSKLEVKVSQKEPIKLEKDASKYVSKSSSLRIEQEVVDELMSLVGEMSVFKEWIGFFGTKLQKEYGNAEASKELKEKYQRLSSLVNSMQNIVLDMRMMPLSSLFERFPKLVRDLSRTLNKKVEFKVEGAETRLDKMIIEKIGEPMVHLIRNAIDHGIESPQKRLELGKNETGLLQIKAYQLAGNVFIEIIDDGGGINTQKVKQKALRLGIVDEEKLKSMSVNEINALVMLPGFSTKDEATEISGRGVGTDAVASAVRSVGGNVRLESKENVGTKITLELPLTLAIQKILLCKIGTSIYGVPADAISEIIRIEKERVSYFKELHVFLHRNDTVVIEYAYKKLGLNNIKESEELTLLIDNSKKRAIAVDSLLNTIDTVIKPVPELIADIKEITGVTILGDGTIVYILDV